MVLALIPAFIASRKHRSFALFFLFGLFCWLPALIVSIVLSDPTATPSFGGGGGYGTWNPQPGGWVPPGSQPSWSTPPPPPTIPAGWYPDPGGSAQQRYWDGTQWTEHLH